MVMKYKTQDNPKDLGEGHTMLLLCFLSSTLARNTEQVKELGNPQLKILVVRSVFWIAVEWKELWQITSLLLLTWLGLTGWASLEPDTCVSSFPPDQTHRWCSTHRQDPWAETTTETLMWKCSMAHFNSFVIFKRPFRITFWINHNHCTLTNTRKRT